MSCTQKIFSEIHIYGHTQRRSVGIYMCKEAMEFLKSESVVVDRVGPVLRFRAATLMDSRSLKFYKGAPAITYTAEDAVNFVGTWSYEIEGDYIYLENKIK